MKPPTLSVVTSFFNEEQIINTFIKRTRKVLKNLIKLRLISNYEIVLVDDASTDNTKSEILEKNNMTDIILVCLSRNFGVGECNFAGFSQARGDLVIYMDCDLQDPPELIEKMVKTWAESPKTEVVYTTRVKRKGENWLKMFITKIGYRLLQKISVISLPPDSGDFKLITRRVVDLLKEMREPRPYTRGLISWVGFRQKQVLYERDERFDGRQNTKMRVFSQKVINYWLDSALISFSDLPLKGILFVGASVSLVSLAYLIVIFVQKAFGFYVPGWPALMTAVLFLGGVQIFMLGCVGLYVGAIFRQTKNRPLYIIDQIFGSSPFKKTN